MRLANVRSLPRTLALCVFGVALPTLDIGLQADDFVIAQRVQAHPFDAFRFMPGGPETMAMRERGILNWSASHDLKLHLLRPLSSLSHALDFMLWPNAAWLMHLENVLLYAALVWAATVLYAELLGSAAGARIAALFYAFSPAHATSVGWISSRNTLLTALFGMLCLLLFVRAKDRWSVLPLSVHALALLAGEAATAVIALLLCYTSLLAPGSWRSRALRLLPHLLLCVCYLLIYVKLEYGAAHSGMYLDGIQHPWTLVHNFLVAVPRYLQSSLLLPIAGLSGLLPSGLWLLVLFACVTLAALMPWVVPSLHAHRSARFFALTALVSIAPLSSVMPQDRLGFFVDFGCCGLLGVCLAADDYALLRRSIPGALFQLHTSCAVVAFVPLAFVCRSPLIGGAPTAINHALTDANANQMDHRDVVVLNAPIEPTVTSALAERARDGSAMPRSLRALYVGGAAYEVCRIDDHTLDLRVARGCFRTALERLARDPGEQAFAPGDTELTAAFTARVLDVDSRGAPLRVRFSFDSPLDDPRWLWLRLDGKHALPWTPPTIGSTEHLSANAAFL